jgi:hypothetical protein
MSDKPKTRVNYTLEESYGGKWSVRIFTHHEVESAKAGMDMIKSMYMLEDPNDINPSIEVKGVEAVDLMFGLEN